METKSRNYFDWIIRGQYDERVKINKEKIRITRCQEDRFP